MPSSSKLIKQGIKYTDKLFDEISERLEQGVKSSDTLEAFLDATSEYTAKNPLISSGYDETMLRLILQETNNHKFSRPSQKELARVTIEQYVGDLIVDVGEDIKDSVREIVKDGYNNNLSQDEIAANISNRVSVIKNKRARAIARTEVARTATVSDYIINKERGATHWYVECRNTACPVCKHAWHNGWTEENDSSFTPSDSSAGGKGWIGDKIYPISDTSSLPPIHPNCYDSETQVFTDNGWKYFKDVTETDKFLSLNPMTNETEFLEPVKLIEVPNVHGKLYHIHNKWFDVCVTPDHDCFIHQRRDGGNRGKYFEPQFRKPSELSSESRFVRCIDTDRENPKTININGLELEPKDYAFFMAWFLSEGSVLHNPETAKAYAYPIKITQEIGENREIIQPVLQRICDKLGLRLVIGKSYFEFYSKEFYDYLEPLGYSHEKYIPSEVFSLNKQCLNIFLDNYVLGDGHERQCSNELVQNSNDRCVFTSSKRLRDDLSYLILLCGYYPSIALHTKAGTVTNHKNGTYTQKNNVYSIRINKSQYTTFSSCTVDVIPYDDYTYCVELPKYHTLWVMRNGKTSWNGNCRCVVYFVNEKDIPEKGVIQDTTVKQQKTSTEPLPSNVDKTIGEKTSNIPNNVRSNLDEFASATKNHNREFSQYYTESGKISELNKGAAHKAYRNPKVTDWVGSQAKQGEIFHFVHNHPTSYLNGRTLLSSEDITIFKEERDRHNLKSFIAEGKNVRVIIGKSDNYDEFSRSQQDKALTNAWHIYEEEYAHSTKRGTVEYYTEIVEKLNDELNKGGMYYRVEERTVESNGEFPKANAVMEKSEIEKLEEKLRQTVDEKERIKILEKLDELSGGFYY